MAKSIFKSYVFMVPVLFVLILTGAESVLATKKKARSLKVKIVVDHGYAGQTGWKGKIARQLRDVAQEIRDALNIKIVVVDYELWEHEEEDDLYLLAEQMVDGIDPGEAEALIGYTLSPCPGKEQPLKAGGVTIPYKGVLVKTYSRGCDRNFFIPYVIIHELIHLFGGVHVYDGSIMSPSMADTVHLHLDPLNKKIVRLTGGIDFEHKYASLGEKRLDKLAGLYEQAIKMGNNEATLMSELGSIHLVLGRYDKAINLFKVVLGSDSSFTHAWIQIASGYHKSNRPKDAIDVLESALPFAKKKGPIRNALASLYFNEGDYRKSFDNAVQAEKLGTEIKSSLWEKLARRGMSRDP